MIECSMTGRPMEIGDGIYDDGEWISWEWINSQLAEEEDPEELLDSTEGSRYRPPLGIIELTEIFLELVGLAQHYKERTGRYLEIWGELGEIFAEIRHGLVRHPKRHAGSDGKIGDTLVEVKTISPEKKSDKVFVKKSGNFQKLLIVKVTDDFWFSSKLFDREELKENASPLLKARWSANSGEAKSA